MSTQPMSPDFNATAAQPPTALTVAMVNALGFKNPNEQVALDMLAAGADVQYVTSWGRTVLGLAVVAGFPQLTKALILKGADPNKKDQNGKTPLSFAVMKRAINIVKILIDNGANPDIAPDGGDPVLVTDLKYSPDHEIARLLLKKGANPNITYGASEMTPLMMVSEKGDEAAIKILLEAGADPLKKDTQGNNAFDYAKKHSPETLALLTSLCHDIFLQADKTPSERAQYMAQAMNEGKVDEKAMLAILEAGADARYMEEKGRSLLDYAAIEGLVDLTKKLIEKGADPNQKNPSGSYPIVYAAYRNYADVVEALIEGGSKVDIGNDDGYPVLAGAVSQDCIEAAQVLLKKGANPNITFDSFDQTPLMLACQQEKIEAIQMLVKAGASATQMDGRGSSSFDYAERKGNKDVILCLKEAFIERAVQTNRKIQKFRKMTLKKAGFHA